MLLGIRTQGIALNKQSTTSTKFTIFSLSSNVHILFICYNFKMVLQEVGWQAVDWIDLAQDKELVNSVMNLRFP